MKIATWCKNDMQKPALLGIPQCRQKLESDLIVDPQPLHFTSCTIQAQILGLGKGGCAILAASVSMMLT